MQHTFRRWILVICVFTTISFSKQVRAESCSSDNPVFPLVFSPDGKYVLTGWDDETSSARLWNVASGKVIYTLTHDTHVSYIYDIAFSPDGKTALTGNEYEAILWDIATGKKIYTLSRTQQDIYGTVVKFSSDGKYIFTGGIDGGMLWNKKTGKLLHKFSDYANDEKVRPSFSSDGKYVLTEGENAANLWDAKTAKKLYTFPNSRQGSLSPNGKYVLTNGNIPDHVGLQLWDTRNYKQIQVLDNVFRSRGWWFSPNSKYLFVIDDRYPEKNTGRVWDIETGKVIASFKSLFALNSLLNDKYLFLESLANEGKSDAYYDYTLWNIQEQKQILKLDFLKHDQIVNVAASPTEDTILISTRRLSSSLVLVNLKTGKLIREFC